MDIAESLNIYEDIVIKTNPKNRTNGLGMTFGSNTKTGYKRKLQMSEVQNLEINVHNPSVT